MKTRKSDIPLIQLLESSEKDDLFAELLEANHGECHTHLLCNKGSLSFRFNDQEMTCKAGEFLFWFADSKLDEITGSESFSAQVLFVERDFLTDNVPDQRWGIDALLYSRKNPVKQINKEDKERIKRNFAALHNRFAEIDHRFYDEALKLQMRIFILEMWHTFANAYERHKHSLLTGTLYEQFIQLVQAHCKQEREVQYYASRLNITAKYLNQICKQIQHMRAW